jgi:hypothetical protein
VGGAVEREREWRIFLSSTGVSRSSVLPLSILTGATVTNASTISVTLSDFSIQCEYVDIGLNALKMLDQTLVDGKSYIHGTTYRTSSASLPVSLAHNT